MKLLYITSSLPIGTQETFIIPEISALLSAGHDITVIPLHPRGDFIHDDARPLLPRSVITPLFSPRLLAGIPFLLRHPTASLRAFKALFTCDPVHLAKNLAAFFKALYLAKTFDLRSFDHIHAHWSAVSSSLALALHHLSGVSWSFTAHRWDLVDNNLLIRKIASASFVRLISHNSLDLVRMHVAAPPMEKIHFIPMGVNIPPQTISTFSAADRPFTLLCPANLLPVKGHSYLIEAIRLLKERTVSVRLIIAGCGPLEKDLRRLTTAAALNDRVEFAGRIPHGKLLALYREQAVDTVVLPSVDLGGGVHEGIPVALIEAMACGIPVLSTATGGIPELLGDGAGIMVPDKDPAALAEAMERLATDLSLRRLTAEKGRRTVSERFAMIPVAARLAALFEAHR
ncbi:MAG TPA: glycosyltransferase [bacterium]|nr:glycosyltransferase [bacterium]